jgi:acyl-CoA dehydrogenase
VDFKPSDRAAQTAQRVRAFIKEHIEPVEAEHWEGILAQRHGGDWTQWTIPPRVEQLKAKARAEGLWNLFMPDPELGAGLSVLEYAFSAEETGRSMMAPEILKCCGSTAMPSKRRNGSSLCWPVRSARCFS